MKVYIRVTRDKYRLITEMGDTPEILAMRCHVEHKTVLKGLERARKGSTRGQYEVVEIGEEI